MNPSEKRKKSKIKRIILPTLFMMTAIASLVWSVMRLVDIQTSEKSIWGGYFALFCLFIILGKISNQAPSGSKEVVGEFAEWSSCFAWVFLGNMFVYLFAAAIVTDADTGTKIVCGFFTALIELTALLGFWVMIRERIE